MEVSCDHNIYKLDQELKYEPGVVTNTILKLFLLNKMHHLFTIIFMCIFVQPHGGFLIQYFYVKLPFLDIANLRSSQCCHSVITFPILAMFATKQTHHHRVCRIIFEYCIIEHLVNVLYHRTSSECTVS